MIDESAEGDVPAGDAVAAAIAELPPTSTAEEKPRVVSVFLAFFAALGGAVAFQAVVCAMLMGWWVARGGELQEVAEQLPKKLSTLPMFVLMASCAQLAMLVTVIAAVGLSGCPWRKRLGLVPARTSTRVNLLAMVGSLVPLAIGFALAHMMSGQLAGDASAQTLMEDLSLAEWAAFILFLATVPAVVEEILFRGYMQRRLLERWRPGAAIAVTSLLFAAMHVMPQAVVALLPLSVWLGLVAWRAGSVYPTMLCHAFINGGVNVWRAVAKFGELSEQTQIVVVAIVLVGSLVCLIVAWRGMFREEGGADGIGPGRSTAETIESPGASQLVRSAGAGGLAEE